MSFNLHSLALTYAFYVDTQGLVLVKLAALTWFLFLFFLFLCVGFSLDYKDEAVDSLLPLKDRLENPDHSILYKTCSDLTKVHFLSNSNKGETERRWSVVRTDRPPHIWSTDQL